MARAALLGRLIGRRPILWRTVTVREVVAETPRAVTLVLDVPEWPGHRAGQHADVRLTAEDGPGFWEAAGYNNYGDPWREQRYWGD